MLNLNLGSGNKKIKNYINLDKFDDDQWDHIVDNNYSKDITKKSLENFIMTILQREQ